MITIEDNFTREVTIKVLCNDEPVGEYVTKMYNYPGSADVIKVNGKYYTVLNCIMNKDGADNTAICRVREV